jgi:hypothetical protein
MCERLIDPVSVLGAAAERCRAGSSLQGSGKLDDEAGFWEIYGHRNQRDSWLERCYQED